jgi:hypothetical protein
MGGGRVDLPDVLLRGLTKAISIQQAPVAGYVARLRRAQPDATPTEIITVLEKQYLAAVTGTGAAVGGAALAPGVGTVVAVTLSGGEMAVFFETTALFALAVAEVHGIRVEEIERRQTLVLAVLLGEHGVKLMEKMAGRMDQRWGGLLADVIPMSSITTINKTLGRWFLTRYVCKLGTLAIGKVAPFGLGVAAGAKGNRALGRTVVNNSQRVFGPAPASFTLGAPVTIIDGAAD